MFDKDTSNSLKPGYGRTILIVQSIYYLLTGLWPLLHIRSFMELTGYKTDTWLVKTVAVLTISMSLTFMTDLLSKEFSTAIAVLSVTSSLGFLLIDSHYALSEVISPVYLADAAVQLVFICWWGVVALFKKSREM